MVSPIGNRWLLCEETDVFLQGSLQDAFSFTVVLEVWKHTRHAAHR